ncbi:glycoside hydrolase family 16 protein [Sphingomonas citri]
MQGAWSETWARAWFGRLKVAVACLAAGAAASHAPADQLPPGSWAVGQSASQPLDLSGYVLSFSDDFYDLDCAVGFKRPDRPHRWYSYGKFGSAAFMPCGGASSTYQVRDGALVITLQNVGGQWRSGALSTYNPGFGGFAQRYGVFAARIRLPQRGRVGAAGWPSFWLLSRYVPTPSPQPYAEIDAFEQFGQGRRSISSTVLVWPQHNKAGDRGYLAKSVLTSQRDILDGQWHEYAVRWTPNGVDVFLDKKLLGSYGGPLPLTPMYPMLSLALHNGPNAPDAEPYTMEVDWVRAYRCSTSGCP